MAESQVFELKKFIALLKSWTFSAAAQRTAARLEMKYAIYLGGEYA